MMMGSAMANPVKYFQELVLCDRLERQGLVNLIMPEKNLLLSDKLVGKQREVVIEAIHTYVQAYYLTRNATAMAIAVSITCGLVIINRFLM